MSLCVLRADGSGYLEVGLDPAVHRTGDVWHIQLQGVRDVGSLCYGWRAGGARTWAGAPRARMLAPNALPRERGCLPCTAWLAAPAGPSPPRPPPPDGGTFHAAYIMLDPYCPRALPVTLPQAAYDSAPLLPPNGRLAGPVLLGSLSALTESFDWGAAATARPTHALEDSVLLELDVAEFTSGGPAGGGQGCSARQRQQDSGAIAALARLRNLQGPARLMAPPPQAPTRSASCRPSTAAPTSASSTACPTSSPAG